MKSETVELRQDCVVGSVAWRSVRRFNFTYALPGGAWLEWGPFPTSDGPRDYRVWFSFDEISKHLGNDWIQRQLKAQGWMTGCWIDVKP